MLDEYRSLEVEGCLQELANLPSEVGPIPWVSGMWFHNEGLTSNTKNDSVTLNSISIGIYVSFCIAWESEHYTTIVTWGRDERRRALSEVSRRSNPIPGMGAWQNERTWGLLYNIEVIEDQANLKETRLENCFFLNFLGNMIHLLSQWIFSMVRKYYYSRVEMQWNLKGQICLMIFEATQATWMVTKWRTSSVRPSERRPLDNHWMMRHCVTEMFCRVFFWNVHYMFNRIYWNTSRI